MAKRKPFALRINEEILNAMQVWADDDLRSLNGQIEYVLRDALRRTGRLPRPARELDQPDANDEDGTAEAGRDAD